MFLEIVVAIVLGVTSGIITGLIPGIHVNLLSLLLFSLTPFLSNYTSILPLTSFIVAMSVTHTFLDPIPSIYLGAPESDTALGVLPGHRYLLNGEGYLAVKLTVIGSLFALILGTLFVPILINIVPKIYPLIKTYIPFLLMGMASFMILRDRKRLWSLAIFLTSGLMGYSILNTYNVDNPLFPLFSGLFGVSTLLYSLQDKVNIPPQRTDSKVELNKLNFTKSVSSSTFAGFLTSMFPGMGGAQGAVIAMQLAGKIGTQGFMVLMGGVDTVNFVLSLVTLYTLDKARNGAVITLQKMIGEITLTQTTIFIFIAIVAGALSTLLALNISKVFSKIIPKINYKMMVLTIVLFITILTIPLSGMYGLLVLITATFLGFLPPIIQCSRTHAMGCLIIPVIIWLI